MPADLDQLQNRIGYSFHDIKLLLVALIHPSCARQFFASNQRFEFLGDRVLGVIIAEEIFRKHTSLREGKLSPMYQRIVSNASLVTHAKAINLGEHLTINLSYPDLRTLESSLADGFEALVGAIYIDGGLDAARAFVLREFAADLSDTTEPESVDNPKGDLIEFFHKRSQPTPTYKVISCRGPYHDRTFICTAMCGDTELARGTGPSKKQAEANAAKAALAKLRAA